MRYKFINYIFIYQLILIGSGACSDDADEAALQGISEYEAATVIENTLTGGSGGVEAQLKQIAQFAEAYNQMSFKKVSTDSADTRVNPLCGFSSDSLITINFDGPNRSFSYNFSWNWTITCIDSSFIKGINFVCTGEGSYDGPELSSEDEFSCNFSLGNLFSGENYVFDGNFIRDGYQKLKQENPQSFTSTVDLSCTDLKINKKTYTHTAGSAMVNITGISAEGRSFKYKGTLTFNDDGTATLKLGSGESYIIEF